MQIKMNKSNFNINKIKQLLLEENSFITDLFSIVDLPNQNKEEVEITAESQNGKMKLMKATAKKGPKASRAKSLEELKARLESLKSKKTFTYKDKLSKKALRTHIKKKIKKGERLNSKTVKVPKAGESNIKSEEHDETEKNIKPIKPVFNSQGKMVFSKFDFSETNNKKFKKKSENDPQKILNKLNKNKEKLEALKSQDAEQAQELKEKMAWKAALAKAEGQKVKDDPDLLKKSVKKQEQIKRASAKKWEARKEGVKKAQEERQRKREVNINKRKDEKKNKKLKRAVKRGRVIPGF
uniref:Putative surfeit locus protein 6 n=1 Tax=Xenopsylla cheopis TaxID=163159 RepID=A0A6M2DI27_XENCH